jgi:hypothetical protein
VPAVAAVGAVGAGEPRPAVTAGAEPTRVATFTATKTVAAVADQAGVAAVAAALWAGLRRPG